MQPDTTDPGYGDFPLKQHLGMDLADDESGRATATIDVGPAHLNPNGVVAGGEQVALVVTNMGKDTKGTIDEPGRYCASVEVSLRFLRPAMGGTVAATAEVTKRGRHLAHLQAEVVGDDGQTVATATGTFAVLGS